MTVKTYTMKGLTKLVKNNYEDNIHVEHIAERKKEKVPFPCLHTSGNYVPF
jgi:hypothetical protein